MTTDRELMQQALDALEGYARNCQCEGGGAPCDAAEALRARLEKWTADDTAYRPGGLPQEEQELVAWSRVNMNDHKEGDLGIGTKPYAAQAAMVDQQTQGRMYVDPVTGDVGIGSVNPEQEPVVKWDASAPLVVHPHPAFQATPPQQPEQEPVAWMYQHEDTGLTMCVVVQQVEPGFEKNNPKWQKIMPLYTAPPHFLDPAKVARLMDEAFERGKKEIDMEQVKDIAQKLADCALLNSAPPQREWMERERAVGYREGHQAALKQREWQTLTDEEMFSLWVKCPAETEDRFAFARAIEAKLKEKNNG